MDPRQPLSVTLPDFCTLILQSVINWLHSAFDGFLFSISEDMRCHRRRRRTLRPDLKQRVESWNFRCFCATTTHPQLPRGTTTCATLSRLWEENRFPLVCPWRTNMVATKRKISALCCYPANVCNEISPKHRPLKGSGSPHTSQHRLSTNRRARTTTCSPNINVCGILSSCLTCCITHSSQSALSGVMYFADTYVGRQASCTLYAQLRLHAYA